MMTLVATPPNLVVNSELLREGYHGFSFFSVTPIGLAGRAGAGYFVYVSDAFHAEGDTQTPQREGWTRRTFRDLIREYRLTGRARRLAIRPGSPMIGGDWTISNYVNVMVLTSSVLNAGGVFVALS